MKVLLTGKDGQLSRRLATELSRVANVTAVARSDCDISDVESVAQTVRRVRPDLIVNGAAYTAVDRAESEPRACQAANADGPKNLAEAAEQCGAGLIHFSTDYVFDGENETPYSESDSPQPLGVYGQSKLAGEANVLAGEAPSLILRIGWLYSDDERSFLGRIMQQLMEKEELRVVNDQTGTPTSASLIARLTADLVALMENDAAGFLKHGGGIVHLACQGQGTWFDFAEEVIKQASKANIGFRAKRIVPISSSEFPLIAARPTNSVLDTSVWQSRFDLDLPSWQEDLAGVFEAYLARINQTARQ